MFAGNGRKLIRSVVRSFAEVPATVGKTVLDAALAAKIDIEAAYVPWTIHSLNLVHRCGGEMACSTCHVILDEENFKKLGEPGEEEQDMCVLRFSRSLLLLIQARSCVGAYDIVRTRFISLTITWIRAGRDCAVRSR